MNSEFEGKLLLFRVVVPLVFGVLCGWLFLQSRVKNSGQEKRRGGVSAIFGGLAVWFSFLVSDLASRGILLDPAQWSSWEAREPWMHWVWAGPLVMCLWLVSESIGDRSGLVRSGTGSYALWLIKLLALGLLSWKMFPGGQGYAQQAVGFRALGVLALIASMLNSLAVQQRRSATNSGWFGWVHVLHVGCIAILVLQSYASLGEWLIFTGSMLVGSMLVGLAMKASEQNTMLELLLGFATVAGLCVSRAYAWNALPQWLLLTLAFLPTLVALSDAIIGKISGGSFWARIANVLVFVIGVLALLYQFVLKDQPQW